MVDSEIEQKFETLVIGVNLPTHSGQWQHLFRQNLIVQSAQKGTGTKYRRVSLSIQPRSCCKEGVEIGQHD